MKKISFSAVAIGGGIFAIALLEAAAGHPPYAFFEAFLLAALIVVLSAMGGFEWGFACLVLMAAVAGVFREAWGPATWLLVIACVWYAGATLLAARGSRVLMGIAAGALFAGLVGTQLFTFSLRDWLVFLALLLLEVSGMYLAGNALKGRWFSPYA